MIPLYIFDIDGTLALAEHRRHLVQPPLCHACGGAAEQCSVCNGTGKEKGFKPKWDQFYDACDSDAPNLPVIKVMNDLIFQENEIWLFTGRTDRVREKTERWLVENTALFHGDFANGHLNMRPHGDYIADDLLKQRMLDAMLPEDRARLVAVFDDRNRVVDMWRRNGIACFQVAPGNF